MPGIATAAGSRSGCRSSASRSAATRCEGRAQDLVRPQASEIQGSDGDAGPVLHRDPAGRGGDAVAQARLGLLQGAARQRHHDRAGPPAGVQHDAAGRADDRRGGRRSAQLLRRAGGAQSEDGLSDRGRLHRVVAHRGDQRGAQSERGQAVRAIHDLAGGAEDDRGWRHSRLAHRHSAAARPAGAERDEIHPGRPRPDRGAGPGAQDQVREIFQ